MSTVAFSFLTRPIKRAMVTDSSMFVVELLINYFIILVNDSLIGEKLKCTIYYCT